MFKTTRFVFMYNFCMSVCKLIGDDVWSVKPSVWWNFVFFFLIPILCQKLKYLYWVTLTVLLEGFGRWWWRCLSAIYVQSILIFFSFFFLVLLEFLFVICQVSSFVVKFWKPCLEYVFKSQFQLEWESVSYLGYIQK